MDIVAPATDKMCCDDNDSSNRCLPCVNDEQASANLCENKLDSAVMNGRNDSDIAMQDRDNEPLTITMALKSADDVQDSELGADVAECHSGELASRASSSESSSKLLEPTTRRPFKPSSSKRQQLIAKEAVEIYLLRPKTKAGKLLRRGSMAHCKVLTYEQAAARPRPAKR